jgi:hypothetical protein
MTTHVSGVSLAAGPVERLSGRVRRAPGTPLRECPPPFGLLLYFAAGSTRRPVHDECGCDVGGSAAAADCRWTCGGVLLSFRGRRALEKQKSEGLMLAAVDFGMTAFDVRLRL